MLFCSYRNPGAGTVGVGENSFSALLTQQHCHLSNIKFQQQVICLIYFSGAFWCNPDVVILIISASRGCQA